MLDTSRHLGNKHIRLPRALYHQIGAVCSVTVCVRDRRPLFADGDVAGGMINVLGCHAAKTGVPVYAYCVMPDHIHLVLGPSPSTDIIDFVGQYKNLAQRAAWSRGVTGSFWQRRFWDHFLRKDEQLEQVISYVLNNPVRRGMVSNWREYGFSGSLALDL